ncbi:MAG: tetratricopeptide repeat protein [Cyanobacteria bacterium CAN_BIN43]|nr:tetratricopeptide repeat protein [Cyanobacteria bacterium CAN_BIN43]
MKTKSRLALYLILWSFSTAIPNVARFFPALGISTVMLGTIHGCTIQANPISSPTSSEQGVRKVQRRDYGGAIDDFSRAIDFNHNDVVAYVNRGIAHDELGDRDNAIEDYSQAIKINPSFAEAYYNRANTYNELGKLEQAIEDYNRAININPKYAYAYANRAVTHNRLNKNQEATEDLQKAAKLFEGKGDRVNQKQVLNQIKNIKK